MTAAHDRAMWAQTPIGRQWETLLEDSHRTIALIDARSSRWADAWHQAATAEGVVWDDPYTPRVAHDRLTDRARIARANTVFAACGWPVVLIAAAALYEWLPTLVSALLLWGYFLFTLFWVAAWKRGSAKARGHRDAYTTAATREQANREWWIRRFGFDLGQQRDPDLNGSWCARGATREIRDLLTGYQLLDYTQVRDAHVEAFTDAQHLPARANVPASWPENVVTLLREWHHGPTARTDTARTTMAGLH
ncbi:MAG: hypothetical protein L0H93_17625 [Nocardioides sp.]|nr:hypothetical protein [Nocardioides sp.]